MSRLFHITGRVLGDYGPRRIRQSTRHFIEIMLPGSLGRQGDGWKMSVRSRLIHPQIRRLARESEAWDEAAYGVPVSVAHLGLASANFSATVLRLAEVLGASGLDADRAQVPRPGAWRAAGDRRKMAGQELLVPAGGFPA